MLPRFRSTTAARTRASGPRSRPRRPENRRLPVHPARPTERSNGPSRSTSDLFGAAVDHADPLPGLALLIARRAAPPAAPSGRSFFSSCYLHSVIPSRFACGLAIRCCRSFFLSIRQVVDPVKRYGSHGECAEVFIAFGPPHSRRAILSWCAEILSCPERFFAQFASSASFPGSGAARRTG